MGLYTNNGLYNSYKKNNKERAALDYYATPTDEVFNILEITGYNFNDKTILEPCVGGGHMVNGIENYLSLHNQTARCIGTDIQDRGYKNDNWNLTYGLDFLSDDYPFSSVDTIIMNPPYGIIEPFLIRALEIAKDKLIVLCRTQTLEGEGRYNNIFKDHPPQKIYQYYNRITCWKNGVKPTQSSAQSYAWLIWDKSLKQSEPLLYWMSRVN